MEIKSLYKKVSQEYQDINLLAQVFEYEKYKLFTLVTSSTQLEGSTLTDQDVEILLTNGRTAQGKPIEHHLMVLDNYQAMVYAKSMAEEKKRLSPELLRTFNGKNLRQTGALVNTALGITDMTKGEFRNVAVKSDALGYYQEASKVPKLVDELCAKTNTYLTKLLPLQGIGEEIPKLDLSFDVHCELVLIHPWLDGNKRTSRLVMNYIQSVFELPLTKVHFEDVKPYLDALKIAKDTGDKSAFREFMLRQHIKTLHHEITEYKEHLAPKEKAMHKKGIKL